MFTDLLKKLIIKVSNWFSCGLSVSKNHNISVLWTKEDQPFLTTFRLELLVLDFQHCENAKDHK